MQKKKLISFLSFAYLFKQKKKSYVFDVKKVIEVEAVVVAVVRIEVRMLATCVLVGEHL